MLVVAEYPCGFCPIHYDEGIPCWHGCWDTRVQFARAARELDAFWQTPAGKRQAVARKESHERKGAVA